MFGIGLPELIVIMALALIVVGPDKLPDLARSVAKGILELKKTANTLKESLTEDGNPLDDIKPELEKAAKALTSDVIGVTDDTWKETDHKKIYDPRSTDEKEDSAIIDVDPEELVEQAENEQGIETKVKETDHSKTEEINKKQTGSEQQK